MNSSQRRKQESEMHNAVRDERLAYEQDRIEDPEKYESARLRFNSELSSATRRALLMLMAANSL